jgi:predicted phage baseplate assembly protein
VYLDGAHDGVSAGSLALIENADGLRAVRAVRGVRVAPRSAYNVSLKTTALLLDAASGVWPGDDQQPLPATIAALRSAQVWTQSEVLALADEPLLEPVTGHTLELAELYDGLEPGRWLTVSGPRLDVSGTHAAQGAELVMIAGVEHKADATLPGDKPHTTLTLAGEGLNYQYRRDAVVVRANVARATHGATQKQTLGAGDGARRHQRFALKPSPLTHVAAATAAGAATTLEVRVNDLAWHETDTVALASPDARVFETRLEDDGITSVIFGDGLGGARLPTGIENVKAVYRSGLGQAGNVAAEAITLLQSRPLGLKGVRNPLPATGGADPETRDQARRNAPLAVMALDRLVSLQDYADFARTFAGIAKASARRLSDGQREVVHLTIAAAGDMELNERSELWQALLAALRRLGDARVPVVLALREPLRVALAARVRLHPDHAWEFVEPRLRAALAARFGFEARELGQPLHLSELLAAAHTVPGVVAVDVDVLRALSVRDVLELIEPKLQQTPPSAGSTPGVLHVTSILGAVPRGIPVRLARRRRAGDPEGVASILPAQLATLDPAVPDTVVLTELPR